MMKTFFWNIRSIKTQKTFHRVQLLNKAHKFIFIALMEPFQNVRHINKYRRRLGMPFAKANCNGKIWLFVNEGYQVDIIDDSAQQLTLKIHDSNLNKAFYATTVYAKCDSMQRVNLWEELYQLHNSSTLPWIISGDFNVVLNENEKIGGVPVQPADAEDFVNCIGSCDLTEVSYRGNPFTWWNGRVAEDCIFERLDRVLVNEELQNWFSQLEVEHLSRTESDHAPMLLTCEVNMENINKPFRFLNLWVEHESFKQVVAQSWSGSH